MFSLFYLFGIVFIIVLRLMPAPVGGYNVCIIERVFGLDINIYGLRRSEGCKLGQ